MQKIKSNLDAYHSYQRKKPPAKSVFPPCKTLSVLLTARKLMANFIQTLGPEYLSHVDGFSFTARQNWIIRLCHRR